MKEKTKLPLLAEMVDSYNLLHSDYLKTDSINESEELLRQLKLIELDIHNSGATIKQSIDEWKTFFFTLPGIITINKTGKDLLLKAIDYISDTNNYNMLDKILLIEEETITRIGKHKIMNSFYKHREKLQQIDETTVIKHCLFSEHVFIKGQAVSAILKEGMKI
jgi:hypothetical protein